jgi:imidazolonepropionase-like amidohydrolase
MKAYLILFSVLAPFFHHAQTAVKTTVIRNGIIHVGNGNVIERGTVVIKGQFIEKVLVNGGDYSGQADTVIDATGKHVYPGLINTNNVLGLHDAEAVRATVDFHDVGGLNPHLRSLIAYNTDNLIIPTIKTNGVLYTQVTPRNGLMSGSSSIMALEGWNWEDAVLKADDGIHINFPVHPYLFPETEEAAAKALLRKYEEDLVSLEKFFSDARAYFKSKNNETRNIRFEAVKNALEGKANFYFHADGARDLINVISFVNRYEIKNAVIVGAKDCRKVATLLKRSRIPVMYSRINDLPDNAHDDIDLINATPAALVKDSILFCLQLQGDMEAMHSRNLPFNAGVAVGYGLTKEQALSAITLNAARILGIDKWVGSIEQGKLASIVISDGDILDIMTNNITFAWIAGKRVTLRNGQTALYERYKQKYGIR